MLSMNLSIGGLGTIFLTSEFAYATSLSCTEDLSSFTRTSNTDVHAGSADGASSVLVDFSSDEGQQVHTGWTASIPGAQWIWGENPVNTPESDLTESFFDVFTVTGTPTGGTLDIATDNTYEAYLNGEKIGESTGGLSGTDGNNFQIGTQDVIPTEIIALHLVSGQNTLEIHVKNVAEGGSTAISNPAGLLYKLTVNKNACDPNPTPVCDPQVNLLENPGFEAPVVDGWSIVSFADAALKWLGEFINPDNTDHLGLEIQNHTFGWLPAEGNQLAELDGYHPTKIWQNVTTIPGNDYALSFKYSPRPGTALGNNVLEVRKDDVALGAQISRDGSALSGTDWTTETRSFVATGDTTKIEFADVSATDDGYGTYIDGASLTCVGTHVPKATIVATKVVCDSEADLPDWSGTEQEIDATTAQAWVDQSEGACRIAPDWKFQWAPTSESNPGDNTVGEVSGWNTFVSSATITLGEMSEAWVREVYDAAYIPFTGTEEDGEKMVSAEMYCNGDVVHYDNLDYARPLTDGGTEYCVAFNALKPVTPPSCQIDGYKYDAENKPVAGIVIGAQTKPYLYEGEGHESYVEDKGEIVVTKTDEDGRYCLNGISSGSVRVFEWPANGTENDRITVDEHGVEPRINSFFDVFPEIAIHMSDPHQPADVNSFFDVFTEIDGVKNEEPSSFFDIFTDLSVGEQQQPTDSFFDVFTEISLDGEEDNTHHTVNFYNKPIPVVADVCPNIEGTQATVPEGKHLDDGQCVDNSSHEPSHESPPGAVGLGFLGGGNNGGGLVLGAATSTGETAPVSCKEYLTDYLRMGTKNNPAQVILLQNFLNKHIGTNIPATGFFGPLTLEGVKKFQLENADQILAPWAPFGLAAQTPTGYVYKTTKRWINLLECKDLNIPLPALP
jgi:hypothetical protein